MNQHKIYRIEQPIDYADRYELLKDAKYERYGLMLLIALGLSGWLSIFYLGYFLGSRGCG